MQCKCTKYYIYVYCLHYGYIILNISFSIFHLEVLLFDSTSDREVCRNRASVTGILQVGLPSSFSTSSTLGDDPSRNNLPELRDLARANVAFDDKL